MLMNEKDLLERKRIEKEIHDDFKLTLDAARSIRNKLKEIESYPFSIRDKNQEEEYFKNSYLTTLNDAKQVSKKIERYDELGKL